jgi:hypothetical protein
MISGQRDCSMKVQRLRGIGLRDRVWTGPVRAGVGRSRVGRDAALLDVGAAIAYIATLAALPGNMSARASDDGEPSSGRKADPSAAFKKLNLQCSLGRRTDNKPNQLMSG